MFNIIVGPNKNKKYEVPIALVSFLLFITCCKNHNLKKSGRRAGESLTKSIEVAGGEPL